MAYNCDSVYTRYICPNIFKIGLIEAALREGCVGHIAEIYDGDDQGVSKGCFAQAWSVGELLRVFAAIEQKHM